MRKEESVDNENYNITKLYKIYCDIKKFIENEYETLGSKVTYINPFWEIILSGRQNFPDFNDLIMFLRNDLSAGIASGLIKNPRLSRTQKLKIAQIEYEEILRGTQKHVSTEFIQSFQESIIGFPYFFEHDSITGSKPFLFTLPGASQIIDFVKKHVNSGDKLNILEIGAGWGVLPYQLLHKLEIDNYVVCDLYENLFISSFFLQSNFPKRKSHYVMGHHELDTNSLVFCGPKRIQEIAGEFDLIINMQSFQEMYITEVNRYIEYSKNHLKPNGILYSENGVIFNKMKLPQSMNDYGYTNFEVLELGFTNRFTPHMFNGSKHEIVVRKSSKHKVDETKQRNLNSLGYLIQLRLTKNIESLISSFLGGSLTKEEIRFLDLINQFFGNRNYDEKTTFLNKISQKEYGMIIDFLGGLLEVTQFNDKKALDLLHRSSQKGLLGLAKLNALSIIYSIIPNEIHKQNLTDYIKHNDSEMHLVVDNIIQNRGFPLKKMRFNITRILNIDWKKGLPYLIMQGKSKISNILNRILKLENRKYIPYCLQ